MNNLIKQMILKLASGTDQDKEQAKQALKRAIELKSANILADSFAQKVDEGYAAADESYDTGECALFTITGTNVSAVACDSEGVPDDAADHNPEYDQVARRISKALSIQRPRGHQAMVASVQRIARSALGRDVTVFVNYGDTSF